MDSGSRTILFLAHAIKPHASARASCRKSHSLIAISPGVRVLSRGWNVTKAAFRCGSAIRSGAASWNILPDYSAGQLLAMNSSYSDGSFADPVTTIRAIPRNQNRVIRLSSCPWWSGWSLVDYDFTVFRLALSMRGAFNSERRRRRYSWPQQVPKHNINLSRAGDAEWSRGAGLRG